MKPGSGPPVQKQQPGPKKRASKRKVPAVAETAAEPEVVVDNPLFCDCSPEQDLDISKEGVHEYERLSIADKLKLEKAYQEYQIAIYLIAIENKLQIKPVLEYLGNNTRPHGPTSVATILGTKRTGKPVIEVLRRIKPFATFSEM
ncbi:hypothetical protein H4Q26_006109 [Puccinia striiformis f. sp. tritici PST-130]|nr:hypothetical protein H4Q26_006109 [Puccinia striiformis f. sp. tritici PST-130]